MASKISQKMRAARWKNKKSAEERFWQKVNKTDTCWLWAASKFHFGYLPKNIHIMI